jgi:hypothetical protein
MTAWNANPAYSAPPVDSLHDLLDNDGFRSGALYGLGAALVVAVVGVALGARRAPFAGLAFAVAAIAALDHQSMLPDDLVRALLAVGAGALVVAALAWRWTPPAPLRWALHALATLPGALMVADVADHGWVVAVVVVGGALVADFDTARSGAGVPPGASLLAVTVFGVWVTTPETQHVVALMGAAVPVAFLGLPWPRTVALLGRVGSAVAVALIAWAVAIDGAARPGALVGGIACLGVLVLAPLVRAALGRTPPTWWVVGTHVVLVGVCARVAGRPDSAALAFAIAAVAYVVAAGVLTRTGARSVAS